MTLFYVVLNTYFISSSRSTPLAGPGSYPADRPSMDPWGPVPARSGARHDGSDLGMRCFVSMVDVGGEDGASGGGSRGAQCITVTLPRAELDRIGQPTVEDIVRPNFTVRLTPTLHLMYRVGQKKLRQIFLAITLVNMDRF